MREELTTVTQDEAHQAARVFRRYLESRFRRMEGKKTERTITFDGGVKVR